MTSFPRHLVPIPTIEERMTSDIIAATAPSSQSELWLRVEQLRDEQLDLVWQLM